MHTLPSTDRISEKRAHLQSTSDSLKREFVGLDGIIDEIIELITPWFLYPELQLKPTIINLWGMTGVGKTSLVKRLSELLLFDQHSYSIDMGDSKGNFESFYQFFKELNKSFPGQPFILSLDEFQYANSKDLHGNELQKTYTRAIWDILDTGTFRVFRDSYARDELKEIISELKFLLEKGIVVKNGLVVENVDYLLALETERPYRGFFDINKEERKNGLPFVKPSAVSSIYGCTDKYRHIIELKDTLLQLNGPGTIEFLEEILLRLQTRKPVDCTRALVFILGNLDEAYRFSSVLTPDVSADEFYENSKSITINNIKAALQQRFRNEQIARLGNNHIIYPAFSKKSYQKIIEMELEKISERMLRHFGISIEFHKSVNSLVYSEGVYPTQGTRPIFSTIQHLIEPHVAVIPAIIAENALGDDVVLTYKKGHLHLRFVDVNGMVSFLLKKRLRLKLDELRTSRRDSLQAIIAVHECGHAVVSALLTGVLPSQIFSVTTQHGKLGMTISESCERRVWTRKAVIAKAAIALAGMAAEKIVFGEENVSTGSSSDIATATEIITALVKKRRIGRSPV